MPLHILLTLVVGGIAGIAVLLHLLGLSTPRRFANMDDAAAAWADEFPDHPAIRVMLSHDHHAAMVETDQGQGIVWPMGADSTARFLTGARVARHSTGLTIHLPDFTAPQVRLRLDPEEAAFWLANTEHPA